MTIADGAWTINVGLSRAITPQGISAPTPWVRVGRCHVLGAQVQEVLVAGPTSLAGALAAGGGEGELRISRYYVSVTAASLEDAGPAHEEMHWWPAMVHRGGHFEVGRLLHHRWGWLMGHGGGSVSGEASLLPAAATTPPLRLLDDSGRLLVKATLAVDGDSGALVPGMDAPYVGLLEQLTVGQLADVLPPSAQGERGLGRRA